MRLYQANWKHEDSVEEWLQEMSIGRTLNLCCGTSKVGDVRVDLSDDATGKNMKASIFDLPFRPQVFDTVIVDPPFEYWNRFKWFRSVSLLARKRVMASSGLTSVRLKESVWKRSLFYFDKPGTGFLRIYWVFDRTNSTVDSWDFRSDDTNG